MDICKYFEYSALKIIDFGLRALRSVTLAEQTITATHNYNSQRLLTRPMKDHKTLILRVSENS